MKLGLLFAALCGSGLIVLATWLRRRRQQIEAAALDQQLAGYRVSLEQQRIGQGLDEGKRASANSRRAEVDRKKREAAQIASGRPVPLIRRVG